MKAEHGRLIEVAETVSIFDEARGLGTVDEGTAVFTRSQKTAVGRLKPVKSGGLWFTTVVYPRISATTSPLLMLTTALSIVEGIAKTTGLQPLLRWPNEVSLNGSRVAAASVEMDSFNDVVVRAYVGGGVYCNIRREDEREAMDESTSIAAELGSPVDENQLLENILKEFAREYELYKAGWRLELINRLRDFMELIRTPVSVSLSHGTQLIGYVEDLDELGRISLKVDQERIFLAPADVESITVF
ncbi:MAG: hypothetical protein RMK31_07770 [Candidatus Caldarchaeum sp.]|nr:hypothetical protein [Candidatus Caldarchaeum sp.]